MLLSWKSEKRIGKRGYSQVVWRILAKDEVVGSIPTTRLDKRYYSSSYGLKQQLSDNIVPLTMRGFVKQKKMSPTKVMKHLSEIRSLIHRMYSNGNIRGAITDQDEALTQAIRMVKVYRKVVLEGIDDEFGGFR